MKLFLVLFIEDDARTGKNYKELLEQDKDMLVGNPDRLIEVIIATNWADAERELKKEGRVFDLIIFDLRFPNTPEEVGIIGKDPDQHERLPEVRKLQPEAAIAIATSYAYADHLAICVEVLAKGWSDEFIPKDLKWAGILQRIIRARKIKQMRDIAAQPYRANVARTVAEDIAASVSMFESRMRLTVHGTALEESLKSELQQLRHDIEKIRSYLLDSSAAQAEPVSVATLIDQIRGHYEGQTGQMLKCSGKCGETFSTYRDDLDVALRAIVQNAIDAVKESDLPVEENAVRVDVDKEGDLVRIRVADHGKGFAPEAIRDLFSPGKSFWTRDTERHKGMGLYVARRRLYSIGGDISVINRDDETQETSVILTVPNWESRR
jgi:signal transduction histidine kinase